jgi:hypothetical protein
MNKSEVIHLRLDAQTIEAIRQQAIENCRTISQEINYILKQNKERNK